MNEIKEADVAAHARVPQNGTSSYAPSAFEYTSKYIIDIIAVFPRNVNPEDAKRLKCAPDGFPARGVSAPADKKSKGL